MDVFVRRMFAESTDVDVHRTSRFCRIEMSDLRYDPVFDVWTVVAENRRDRPLEFVPNEQVRKPLICPFCAGNEDETPPPLALHDSSGELIGNPSSADWTARVFVNRYPTFTSDTHPGAPEAGPYRRMDGNGIQELVIPTPRHVSSLSELELDELTAGLVAAQKRIVVVQQNLGLVHAMLFCNCRFEAGASIEHVHFQLIGSPLTSPAVDARLDRMNEYQRVNHRSMLTDVVTFEKKEARRMIAETEHWTMFCPLASRMPFQVWIVPRKVSGPFSQVPIGVLGELAKLVRQYVQRLEQLLGEPGYNWMLHQPAFAKESHDNWFVEIVPRLAKTAGYELGADIWVNPVSPETAARRLRQ